jgi:hypothetical protein
MREVNVNKKNHEALVSFSPLGPYSLCRKKVLSKVWMSAFYVFQIISIFLFIQTDIDLIAGMFVCSGLACCAVTPKIEDLVQLRSGKSVSNRQVKLALASLAFLLSVLLLVKVINQSSVHSNYAVLFSVSVALLFLIFLVKISIEKQA